MKKRFTFLFFSILALFVSLMVSAQTDKGNGASAAQKSGLVGFTTLMRLADSLFEIDNATAVAYAKQAKTLSLMKGDTMQLVYATRVIGQLENRLGNIDSAIQQFTYVLPIAERNNRIDDLKRVLNSLATSFTYKGEYGRALEYHFKSLILREKAQNKKEISITLHNIASVYISASNHEQALPYVMKCLRIKKEIHDSLDLDRAYLNLGVCHTALGNETEARAAYDSAITICQPNCSRYILTMTYYGLGEIHLRGHNPIIAKMYFEKSLALSIQENDLQMHLYSLLSLAQVANEEGDLAGYAKNLFAFEGLPGRMQFPVQMLLFYDLSGRYHALTGNFRSAFASQKKYSELTDSISSAKMDKKITDMQLEFAERENIQKIHAQQELLNAQTSSINKQEIINLLLLGVALLTVILALVLFKMNRRKSRINEVLDFLVKERTLELEKNGMALKHAYDEQSITLERVSRDLVSALATIQGLNHVAALENHVTADLYLKGAEAALAKSIRAIQAGVASDQSHVGMRTLDSKVYRSPIDDNE